MLLYHRPCVCLRKLCTKYVTIPQALCVSQKAVHKICYSSTGLVCVSESCAQNMLLFHRPCVCLRKLCTKCYYTTGLVCVSESCYKICYYTTGLVCVSESCAQTRLLTQTVTHCSSAQTGSGTEVPFRRRNFLTSCQYQQALPYLSVLLTF